MKHQILTILLLLVLSIAGSSQTITRLEINENFNTRSSKLDTIPFDWYTKQSLTLELDSIYLLYGMFNIERDNGIEYYSYEVKFQTEYFTIKRFYDTEKEIDLYTSSVYYPFLKHFKVGYDFSYISQKENHNIYVGFSYKDWISAECAFLTELLRYQVKFKPSFTLWKQIKIGPVVDVISVDENVKWSAGLNLNIKIL